MNRLAFIFVFLFAVSCVNDIPDIPGQDIDETLASASTFPVGNVWSGGHPAWGNSKGTDLGGPADDFSGNGFGLLSTIKHKQLEFPVEDEILARQFNSITPEVALKMHNISVSPDSIDFREADAMMAFAEANNMRVHGHVILFDSSVPEWARQYERSEIWTPQQWEAWLENYINKVVGRYRGQIAAWDVLNEITVTIGEDLKGPDEFFWYRVIGPDVIEKAFRWMEAADPDAKLFINEFAMELFPGKLDKILGLANELRANGCKVDGIGFQGHIILPLIQGDYATSVEQFSRVAGEGYLVHISELDVAVNILGVDREQKEWQHVIQRQAYNEIARAYRDGVPLRLRWGITHWNISDKNGFSNLLKILTDLRIFGGDEFGLMWDNDYEKKPAFFGFRNGVKGIEEQIEWVWGRIPDDQFASRKIDPSSPNNLSPTSFENYPAQAAMFMYHLGFNEHDVRQLLNTLK